MREKFFGGSGVEKTSIPLYSRMSDARANEFIGERVDLRKIAFMLERFYRESGNPSVEDMSFDELFGRDEWDYLEGYYKWLENEMQFSSQSAKEKNPYRSIEYALARTVVELRERMHEYDLLVIEGRGGFIPGVILQEVFERSRGILPVEGGSAREEDLRGVTERKKDERTRGDTKGLIDAVLVPSNEYETNAEQVERALDTLGDRKFQRALIVADVLYLGATTSGLSRLLSQRGISHDVASIILGNEPSKYLESEYFCEDARKDSSFALIYGFVDQRRDFWTYFSRIEKNYPVIRRTDDEIKMEREYVYRVNPSHQRIIARDWRGKKMETPCLDQKERVFGEKPRNTRIIPALKADFEKKHRKLFFYGLRPLCGELVKLVG